MESEDEGCLVEQWANTQSTVSNVQFTWTINNFSFYKVYKTGTRIESPVFSADEYDGIKWRLVLYPKGEYKRKDDFLSIFIELESAPCNESKVSGKYNISILNADSKKEFQFESFYSNYFELYRPIGFPYITKRCHIFNKPEVYLPKDKLNIFCEISYVTDSITSSSQKSLGKFKFPDLKITDDFGNLLGSRKFSDITLVVDDHEFPAHKAILAVRSEVFAAMFAKDTEDVKTGRVNLTDVSREVFQEILSFIYTEEVPNLKTMAHLLLPAANKYELKKLKVMSEMALFDQLSEETVIDTLILAGLHSASQLKKQTMGFIKTHAKTIVKTEKWQKMKAENANCSLIAEILEAFI